MMTKDYHSYYVRWSKLQDRLLWLQHKMAADKTDVYTIMANGKSVTAHQNQVEEELQYITEVIGSLHERTWTKEHFQYMNRVWNYYLFAYLTDDQMV